LGQLLDEHGPALALYAAQWTDAADDCVQEALVELARQPTLPDNLRAWLYRVVKNRALNAARSDRRRRDRERRAMHERLVAAGSATANDYAGPLAIAEALERLKPAECEIVVMRIWGGLNYQEIAAALGSSTSTVHRQYQRALEQLRQILETPCSTSNPQKNSSSRPS
jgi:RNA polymerase sigma-70 factor (ECF subfamily)